MFSQVKWAVEGGAMDSKDVLESLVKRSGLTYGQVSRALRKSPQWARNSSINHSKPLLDTVADVADVCGVDVKLVDRGTGEVVALIDPPHKVKGEG
jgi:hypothetical protein